MRLDSTFDAIQAEWRSTVCRVPYSDAEWANIVALLPNRPQASDAARCRFDIEASAYLVRSGWQPTNKSQWIAAWQRVAKAAEERRAARSEVSEVELQETIDADCLREINEANARIRSLRAATWPRRKNNDPAIAQLIGQLLNLWTLCRGRLTITTVTIGEDEGHPAGKLIGFLRTATNPICLASKRPPFTNNRLAHLIKQARAEQELASANGNLGRY